MHSLLLLALASGALCAADVPTVHFPLNWQYGRKKISTNLMQPWAPNTTIEVVFDQGSENFWVFDKDATHNWGCRALACQGQCNETVPLYYDEARSTNASDPEKLNFFNAYGAYTKVVQGDRAVKDNLHFSNDNGETSITPPIRVALVNYMQERMGADEKCTHLTGIDYSIMGTAPWQRSRLWNTTGPHVRQQLLESGAIKSASQSMWFNKPPKGQRDTFTGGALFGGIDMSKFTGPLVKIQRRMNDQYGEGETASVGYWTPLPKVTVAGEEFGQTKHTQVCLLDSGTTVDTIPISDDDAQNTAFFKALGLVSTPKGQWAYNGNCDEVPEDITVDYTFPGQEKGENVTIKVPLRNYMRVTEDNEEGYCGVGMDFSGCLFGSPFASAAFFAADDDAGTLALAQGGVSEIGSGVDYEKVVLRLP